MSEASKRTRRRRGHLTRLRIVESALTIADRDGLEGLTVRRLAELLDTSPMAIYRHFKNKREIIAQLLDRVAADYQPQRLSRDDDWRGWIADTFANMRTALLAHPGVVPLVGTAGSFGPNALRAMDVVIGALRSNQFSLQAAVATFHQLISYTVGAVAIEGGLRREFAALSEGNPREQERRLRLMFESLPLSSLPNVVEGATALGGMLSESAFRNGISAFLA